MGTGELVGKRSKRNAAPRDVLEAAGAALARLKGINAKGIDDFRALKRRYAPECRTYYSVAALSRRRVLDDASRAEALSILFRLRAELEETIISDLNASTVQDKFIKEWATRSFFGVSAKQGVSVRYALASCVPTRTCGGRCYAHDGRDREIHHIFRGALNLFVGQKYGTL